MPRPDRLFALVQLLSAPGRRRLDELARELGTSPRSIYRDLADLEARGVPIERTQGAYRLLDGATIRPVPLTSQERLLLTLALENPELQRQPEVSTRRSNLTDASVRGNLGRCPSHRAFSTGFAPPCARVTTAVARNRPMSPKQSDSFSSIESVIPRPWAPKRSTRFSRILR